MRSSPLPRPLSRATLLVIAASLLWLPSAEGKGLRSVTACGGDGCSGIDDPARAARVGFGLLEAAWEGRSTDPPAVASDWFRIEFRWLHGARGGDAIEEVILPATLDRAGISRRGRAEWVELAGTGSSEYVRWLAAVEPLPAESFPSGLGVRPAPSVGSDSASGVPWLPLAAGVGFLVSAGGFVARRRVAPSAARAKR